jgi:hypothetical protein
MNQVKIKNKLYQQIYKNSYLLRICLILRFEKFFNTKSEKKKDWRSNFHPTICLQLFFLFLTFSKIPIGCFGMKFNSDTQ